MDTHEHLLKLLAAGDYKVIRKDKRNRLPEKHPFRVIRIEFRYILKTGTTIYNWLESSPTVPIKGRTLKKELFKQLAILAYDEMRLDGSLKLVRVDKVILITESLIEVEWKKHKPLPSPVIR